jgi:hypothetical protein
MTTTAQPYSAPRINFRILAFVGIFGLLLALPIYWWLEAEITGGIRQRGEFLEVDLKAMSSFTFDQNFGKVDDIPEKWRNLDGKRVILHGEMAPGGTSVRGDGQYFQLVYSVEKCCFSGPPQIQHFVQASIPFDRLKILESFAQRYRGGPIEVRGTLRVDVERDETDKITGVYHLDVEEMKPL